MQFRLKRVRSSKDLGFSGVDFGLQGLGVLVLV